MAGMAAEGREIPIADRELTRGRRGTHSDRAQHHRRWFRAPARCRPETGAPPSARLRSWGYAVSTASRRSMPVGDRRSAVRALLLSWGTRFRPPLGGRCRSETGAPPSARFCSVGGTRFRPPPGGRCRSETGAPPSARFCSVGGTRFRPPLGGRCRSETGAPPSARFCSVGGTRFRPPLGGRCRSETGAPPSARFCSVGGTRFRPPLGGRCRSETGAPPSARFCSVGGTRFRPPLGGRCRSETGAPPSARFCSVGGTRFRPPLGGRCRSETGAPPSARFCSVGGTRFRPPLGGRCRSETGAPPSARFCSVGGTRFRPPLGGRCRSETGAPPSPRLFALDDARSRCASRSEKSGLRSQSPETSPLRNSSSRIGSKKLSGISIPLSIPTGRCFTGVGGSGRISTISTFLRHSTTRSPRKAASTIRERCVRASARFTRITVLPAQRSGTGGPKARSSSTTMTPFSST